MGTAWRQRRVQGSRARAAGKNTINVAAPMLLAPGEAISRDRNQRIANKPITTGTRKMVMPTYCSSKSLTMAPKRPIQFLAGRDGNGEEAVFTDGSSGE